MSDAKTEVLDAIETLADYANDRAVSPEVLAAADYALKYVYSERER